MIKYTISLNKKPQAHRLRLIATNNQIFFIQVKEHRKNAKKLMPCNDVSDTIQIGIVNYQTHDLHQTPVQL